MKFLHYFITWPEGPTVAKDRLLNLILDLVLNDVILLSVMVLMYKYGSTAIHFNIHLL